MASRNIKGLTIEIDGETTGLSKALSAVNSDVAKTQNELNDVNKLLKFDPSNVDALAQKQELLAKQTSNVSNKLQALKDAQAQVKKQFESGEIDDGQYRAFQREVIETESKLNTFGAQAEDVGKKLSGAGNDASQATGGIDKFGDSISNIEEDVDRMADLQVGEFFMGLADKASEIGGELLETGMGFSDAQSLFQSSMGQTATEAKASADTVKSVFKSGVVESVDEATEAVKLTQQAFGGLAGGKEVTDLSLNLATIAKHSGTDLVSGVNASSQAMKAMGLTSTQATDLISKGLQDGLNKNDDFLDTVNEYAPTFADAGLSAGNMLSVLNAGMENGAFNTDKTADAVKEFNVKLQQGQLDQVMGNMSKATQDVFQQFKNGKATSAEVMSAVGKDIKGMPLGKAKDVTAQLGSQFEDLGVKASSALLEATTKTTELDGATDKMTKKTPGEKLAGSLNTLKTALSDMVSSLTPVIDKVSQFAQAFNSAPPIVKQVVAVIGAVMIAITLLLPVLAMLTTVGGALNIAFLPLIGIIAGIAVAITAIILVIMNWTTVWNVLKVVVIGFGTFLLHVIQGWGIIFVGLFNMIKAIFVGIGQILLMSLQGWVLIFTAIFNGIKTLISMSIQGWVIIFKAVFALIATIVKMSLQMWVAIFTTTFNVLKALVTGAWNVIKVVTSTVFTAIKTVITTVFNGLVITIRTLVGMTRSVISAGWNFISSTTRTIFNAIVSTISRVFRGAVSIVSGIVNSIRSAISGGFGAIRGIVSGVFSSVTSTISNVFNGAVGIVSGIVNKIKSLFSFKLSFPEISIPHIPMPHFNLSGSFNPLKLQVPKLSIDWYAKGGVMTKPTMFGMNGNSAMVGGEAGAEAIVPLRADVLAGIGKGIADASGMGGTTVIDNSETNALLRTLIVTVGASFTPDSARQAVEFSNSNKNSLKNMMSGGV